MVRGEINGWWVGGRVVSVGRWAVRYIVRWVVRWESG